MLLAFATPDAAGQTSLRRLPKQPPPIFQYSKLAGRCVHIGTSRCQSLPDNLTKKLPCQDTQSDRRQKSGTAKSKIEPSLARRVANELGAGFQSEFFQAAGFVGLDRLHADVE